MSDLEPLTKPDFAADGDEYRLTWAAGIEAVVERIAEHRDELTAEVTIRSTREPSPGLLHSARLNLMSTQARRTLAGALREREPALDWGGMLEQLAFLVRERYRNGEPSIDMREYEAGDRPRWLIEPFIESAGASLIFADGGTGKSMLATALAASVASGQSIVGRVQAEPVPVLYLDWEADADTFHERLAAIAMGAGLSKIPPVHYRRQVASLAESAAEIRREVRRTGSGLVIVDSLGAARGGEPESADVTIKLFVAARSLGVPWAGVDHVTKAAGNDATRPFGSAFTSNLARLTWGADKAQDEGDDSIVLALANRKRNNGRLLPRQGFRIRFENDTAERLFAVRFTRTDLTGVAGLAEKLPLTTRILAELRPGPMSQADLAENLGADIRAVSARVGDLEKQEKVVRLEDRRVALRARAS